MINRNIITLLFSLFLIACDYTDKKLSIINNSNDTIFFHESSDTLIQMNNAPLYYKLGKNSPYAYEGCLLPQENERAFVLNTTWKEEINSFPDRKLKIIFFSKKLLDNVKWVDIVKSNYYSKRMEFTVEELEKLDWKVVYSDSVDLKIGFDPNK